MAAKDLRLETMFRIGGNRLYVTNLHPGGPRDPCQHSNCLVLTKSVHATTRHTVLTIRYMPDNNNNTVV
jgi:hypothetical protein